MKNNKTQQSTISIKARLLMPNLLNEMVEEEANSRFDIGYSNEPVQKGWKAIETAAVEAYANGDINLDNDTDIFIMGFTTSFIFTCIKNDTENYRLEWCNSLS